MGKILNPVPTVEGQSLSQTIFNHSWSTTMPKLLTAKEVAEKVCGGHIKPERISELAEAGMLPHARLDNGGPLFSRRSVLQWLKDNLFIVDDGRNWDIRLEVFGKNTLAERSVLPVELKQLEGALRSFDGHISYPTCVYFLVRGNKVVYVGQSVSLSGRLAQHVAMGKKFDQVFYLPWPKASLCQMETKLIKALVPEYNKESIAAKERQHRDQGNPPTATITDVVKDIVLDAEVNDKAI